MAGNTSRRQISRLDTPDYVRDHVDRRNNVGLRRRDSEGNGGWTDCKRGDTAVVLPLHSAKAEADKTPPKGTSESKTGRP